MGGYSHRRFDEAIFGGVTRYMLNRSNRTILMAH
jgi:nucleotide-binding universal stress UspA family protein